jgi:hypothetical protein
MKRNHFLSLAGAISLLSPSYPAHKPRKLSASTKMFSSFSGRPKLVGLVAAIAAVSLTETLAAAEQKPTIPIVVKDTTT